MSSQLFEEVPDEEEMTRVERRGQDARQLTSPRKFKYLWASLYS